MRLHLERPLEGLVRPSRLDDAVLVDQEEEARGLVRDRAEELALALAGRCLLVAGGDVDAAGDDSARPAVLVVKRSRAPEDDARLAAAVDERVLVLDGRVLGRGCPEAGDHVVALRVVDEDVPEVAAADRLLVVLSRGLDGGRVLVHDPALRVEMHEQARRGVDEGDEEAELGSQLGLQPDVLERQPDRGRDEIDRVRLVGERRVVHERRDPSPVALDRRHRPVVRGDRLRDIPALGVDPALAVAEPVDDLQRGVVQGIGDGVAERDARVQREQHATRRGAVEAGAQHAGEEREGDRRERDQEEHPHDRVRPRRNLIGDDGRDQENQSQRARDVHGPERPSLRARRPPPPLGEDDDDPHEDDAHHDRPGEDDACRVRRSCRRSRSGSTGTGHIPSPASR